MIDISAIDYSALDRPEILMNVFHPRPDTGDSGAGDNAEDMLIQTEKDIVVGARFYLADKEAPNILFFHGNGEIVADYDDIAPLFTKKGLNLLPVDYRGYGRSTGNPTISGMMKDAHAIFDYVKTWLDEKGYKGTFVVMGRSLGSASALEISSRYRSEVDVLIIESGFAHTAPLLKVLGFDIEAMGISEDQGFRNADKIRSFNKSTLIIHAENDHIIPLEEGQALYEECRSRDKQFLVIPGANHNDILYKGGEKYMEAVKDFSDIII